MKVLTSIIFILIANYSIAQLSVRNSAFVYVTDEVIFVEDDVNIIESSANIYLRDEAQLLQGSGTSGNSGIGKLSIYQNGTVNQYAYNYWCSPVGNVLANNDSNRPFRANNNIYDVTAAPITSMPASFTSGYDGTSSPLVISSFWLYSYDPGIAYSEWDFIAETGDLTTGYGFTMKGTSGSGNNQLYDFRGKPNSGAIPTNVLAGQETLVGNPYPSALDALDYIHDPQNVAAITGELFYWEQAPGATSHVLSNYVGGYATYTISNGGVDSFTPATFTTYLLDGTPTNFPAGTGTKIARRYIPVGQGFMIEGRTGTTGVAFAKNAHREYYKQSDTESFFFRSSNGNFPPEEETLFNEDGLNIVPDDFKRFRVNVDFNEIYTRQLLMNFHHTATNGFDYGLEGKSSEPLNSDAYWILEEVPYAIQAFNFETELRIPLVVTIENQQLVRFRIFDIQNFDDSQPIYIHDIENNIYVNLRLQNYEITLPPGNYTNRFEVTFTSESLSNEDIVLDDFNVFQNNQLSELTIENPRQLNITNVSLFDINGKRIFNEVDLPIQTNHTFTTKNLSEGVYVTKIVVDYDKEISKKVIVTNKK